MEFTFTLKYQLAAEDRDPDALVERLAEAGCEDALVGIGQPGRLALEFTREADSASDAIISALRDVQRAIPSARIIEAGPDFVGLTDVAELTGMTRQYMRKLMVTNSNFPLPVHEGHQGNATVWHLADVLTWLQGNKRDYAPAREIMDVAEVAWQVNVAKEDRRLSRPVNRELSALVG